MLNLRENNTQKFKISIASDDATAQRYKRLRVSRSNGNLV